MMHTNRRGANKLSLHAAKLRAMLRMRCVSVQLFGQLSLGRDRAHILLFSYGVPGLYHWNSRTRTINICKSNRFVVP